MGIKVTQDMDDVQTTAHMRLLSLVLLGISLFFFLLFFVYWSAGNTQNDLGNIEGTPFFYHLLITITTLTITLLVMHFYTGVGRIYSLLKYSVIVGNAIVIGFAIDQSTRGSDTLFGPSDNTSAVEYTYAGLGLGFAGIGTLLCIIHNFYGISRNV